VLEKAGPSAHPPSNLAASSWLLNMPWMKAVWRLMCAGVPTCGWHGTWHCLMHADDAHYRCTHTVCTGFPTSEWHSTQQSVFCSSKMNVMSEDRTTSCTSGVATQLICADVLCFGPCFSSCLVPTLCFHGHAMSGPGVKWACHASNGPGIKWARRQMGQASKA